jgi:lipopolysaccharide export system protein LptA
MIIHLLLFFFLSFAASIGLLGTTTSWATSGSVSEAQASADAPLEIEAGRSLEWEPDQKRYVATGGATARQGDFELQAEELIAEYQSAPDGSVAIQRIVARGNVRLQSADFSGRAAEAIYDVTDNKAQMLGGDLVLQNNQMTLTARDRFDYFIDQQKLIAVGSAKIVSDGNSLTANQLTAWFQEQSNPSSSSSLNKAEAIGNVVITSAREKATATRATYTAQTQMVELMGNVEIAQGPNRLSGEQAQMNLRTNVSKMFSSSAQGTGTKTSIKGVFYSNQSN